MSQITHKPRQRSWRVICLVVATGGFVLTLGSGEGWASETRSQRCTILQNQLNDEIKDHPGSSRSANATTIGTRARKLCAAGKQAQGLRAYVKALQLFGVQPIDPK